MKSHDTNGLYPSKFNTLAKEGDLHAVYNGVSREIVVLNNNTYDCLQSNNISNMSDFWRTRLLEIGAITTSHEKQVEALKNLYNRFFQSKNYATIVVCPTMNCNLTCEYCYEKHLPKDKTRMSRETIKRTILFIKKSIDVASHEHVTVKFYGGEPLLEAQTCIEIAKEAFDYAQLRVKRLFTFIQSNGTLLNEEILTAFPKIDSLELTLEGPATIHDPIRTDHHKRPTFESIVASAQSASELNIPVSFRINSQSVEDMQAVLEELDEVGLFAFDDVTFYVGQVSEEFKDDLYGHTCPAHIKSNDMVDDLISIRNYVFKSPYKDHFLNFPIFRKNMAVCDSERGVCFNIDPKGDVYSCLFAMGMEEFLAGNIDEDGNFDHLDLVEQISLKNPFENSKCLDCNVLPQCWGGCFLKAISNGNNPDSTFCGFNEMKREIVEHRLKIFLKDLQK